MEAAVWHAAGDVRIEQRTAPRAPRAGEALVAVAACGVCGTDVHEYASGPHFIQTGAPHPRTGAVAPLVIGHEIAGVVAALGPDAGGGLSVGDRVAVDVIDGCGRCAGCATGARSLCDELALLGSHADGGFAETLLAPASGLHPVPDGVDLAEACLADPVATAVHAVARARIAPGERAWVSGCGPIGLSIVQVLRAAGVEAVDCGEPDPERARVARELGARVPDAPQDEAYDVAFEASGAAGGLERCMGAVRPRGRVLCVSVWGEPPRVDLNAVVVRERELIGCLAYEREEFATALRMIADGTVRVAPYITSRIPLGRLVESGLRPSGREGEIKVVVELHDAQRSEVSRGNE